MIAAGHNARDVMDYTPRQLAAFHTIASHRKRRELAEQLHIGALAARGESKTIQELMKELSDDGR